MTSKTILTPRAESTAAGSHDAADARPPHPVEGELLEAFANLKRLCEAYMPGRYKIEVIDLLENPQLAAGDQIFALPTLVRKLPPPLKRIIGNLSDTQKFLVGMDLKSEG